MALFYTEQRALRLPGLLLRMLARACAALQESQAAAEAAHNELRRKGLSEAQVTVLSSGVVCAAAVNASQDMP